MGNVVIWGKNILSRENSKWENFKGRVWLIYLCLKNSIEVSVIWGGWVRGRRVEDEVREIGLWRVLKVSVRILVLFMNDMSFIGWFLVKNWYGLIYCKRIILLCRE